MADDYKDTRQIKKDGAGSKPLNDPQVNLKWMKSVYSTKEYWSQRISPGTSPPSAEYLNSQGAVMVQEIRSALPESGRTHYGPVGEPPMFELIENRSRSACPSGAQFG